MPARKHIIIVKLFEFSGTNTHLKALLALWGEANIILVLEDEAQLAYLNGLGLSISVKTKIYRNLYGYAHLRYRFTTNLKELFFLVRSIFAIQLLSLRHGFADVTISAIEPEKYLYMFWMPFAKVFYILHTAPNGCYTLFTSYTCNRRLNNRRSLVTVSKSNADLVCEAWQISHTKRKFVHMVYNCVVENMPPVLDRKMEPKLNVLTMGHLVPYKNPYIWLDVAKAVTAARGDISFTWLGNGPLLDELRKASAGLTTIMFPGAVANPASFLADATVYYQPSLHETHGIGVIEAMHYGLPCVVSNVGGMPESVEHHYNGLLVEPNDVTAHTNAILTLLDDKEFRKRAGENSYHRSNELFSFNKFEEEMNFVYL